ncbi:MAG: HigA family addiction module antitoxin [Verrucomicrobiota bacterium]
MSMYNPPHPGEFIEATYMEPFGLSCRFLATKLDVSASTLNRVLKRQSSVSPEMALRLSKALGRTPESWLAMQDAFNLWKVRKRVKLNRVHPVELEQHVYVAAG